MKRILCFGDSITAGSELPVSEKSEVWPTLITAMSKGAFQCLNAGKGGRPTNSFGEFVKEWTRAENVDLLVLALGGNDARDLAPDCADRAAAHLEKMIAYALNASPLKEKLPILLIAPTNIKLDSLGPTRPIGPQRDAQLKRIGSALKQLALRLDIAFADTYGIVSLKNLTRDGVHPNAAGNHEIAEYLFPLIRRLLERS